ncbi:MAG: hypothetical protein ACKOFT_01695 [Actinomycetota bacterium]
MNDQELSPRRAGRNRRRVAVCTALVAVTTFGLLPGSPGRAAEGGGSANDDSIEAEVRDGTPPAESTAGVCTWQLATGVDPVTGLLTEQTITRVRDGQRETLFQRTCTGQGHEHWYQWIRDSTTARLRTRAEATATERLVRLLFRTAPPQDRVVVNVGTWFWVPRAVWKPVSATAYVATPAGIVSVTVTATPSRLRFDPGNGDDAVWCSGPGEAWTPRHGDTAVSDCMYTYRRASTSLLSRRFGSTDGRFRARTAVEWKVRVTSNFGLAFPLPNVRTGLATPVTVHELQALLRG